MNAVFTTIQLYRLQGVFTTFCKQLKTYLFPATCAFETNSAGSCGLVKKLMQYEYLINNKANLTWEFFYLVRIQ